jgi:predicted Zn-dependent protease
MEPSHFKGLSASLQIGTLYGAALAALKLHDFSQTRPLIEQLLDRTLMLPEAHRLAQLLEVEIALAQGDTGEATLKLRTTDIAGRAGLFLAAENDTRSGRAGNAAQNLRTWLADHPHDAQAWQLLAHANTALGHLVAAVRDEAEANMAQLDYASARARFKAALDLSRSRGNLDDPMEVSIVQTRSKQVDSLLREQALER